VIATSLDDETIWGLPGAIMADPIPGAERFSTTPLAEHLRIAAAFDPQAVAVVGQTGQLRHADLLRLARNVAGAVAACVPPGRPVACLLPRSPAGIAGLLGCLISGRLCMVLDPANPPERQASLLADAAPAALLVAQPPPFAQAAPVLMLAQAMAQAGSEGEAEGEADPDAPLVVHFTSGSSGRPKGIVLSARSVLFRSAALAHRWALTPQDRVFAPSMPIASSGLCMLLAALTRGALVVLADVAAEGANAVLRLVEREGVTCAAIQPPMMRLFFRLESAGSALRTLRSLRIGASALSRVDLAAWRPRLPPGCAVWHSYASTEAIEVAGWAVPPDESGPEATVAAGMLQASHDYALLDENDRPVRPGEAGEMVLRSRYVALGEWQGGRLIPGRMPPVAGRPGWRLFRTGDLLLVQPDGLMRLLGRADRQVKINGVRVEPGEIEAVLRTEPGVADAAVVANADGGGVTLHGFVVSAAADRAALVASLRRRLSAALPSALNPARLTVLDRLPLLPGGKVDLVALAARSGDHAAVQPPSISRL
jgi:non-ribosomal peptide synthetase component F